MILLSEEQKAWQVDTGFCHNTNFIQQTRALSAQQPTSEKSQYSAVYEEIPFVHTAISSQPA